MACATARIVSHDPWIGVDDALPVGGCLLEQQTRCADTRACDEPARHSVTRDGAIECRRHRIGIADVTVDVAALDVPHDDVVVGCAEPLDDRCADARCPAGDDGRHTGGPISSTRTPSGAVITAIATVFPPGAGISMRRPRRRTPGRQGSPGSARHRIATTEGRNRTPADRAKGPRRWRPQARRVPRCRYPGSRGRQGRSTAAGRWPPEQGRPVAGEGVVEQLGEAETVAPEPHRGVDVGGHYRRMVDS